MGSALAPGEKQSKGNQDRTAPATWEHVSLSATMARDWRFLLSSLAAFSDR